MSENNSKFNWGAMVGPALAVLAQLAAVVIWLSSEHSARVELEHRFNNYQSDQANRVTAVVRSFDQQLANQNNDITRHEAMLNRLDSAGGRQLGIVTEKQLLILEIIKVMQRDIDELKKVQNRHTPPP